jgi:multisubunit Na+/H+ antiporter MnhE subunit
MRRGRQFLLFLLTAVALFLLWALLTSGFKSQEMLMGAGAALLAALLFLFIRVETGSVFQPTLRDLIQLWRLPWYILSDSWTITVVLVQDLFGIRPAGSHFRSVSFDAGDDHDLRAVTRRALATIYTTVSPNSIILGVDSRRHQLLFHQLRPTPVTTMTRRLGARP